MNSIPLDDSSALNDGSADLGEAWKRFLQSRSQQDSWHFQRFLVKGGQLASLTPILHEAASPGSPRPLGIWLEETSSADALAKRMLEIAPALADFAGRHKNSVLLDRFFAPMPASLMSTDAYDSFRECLDVVVHVLENHAPTPMQVYFSQQLGEQWRLQVPYAVSMIDYYNRSIANKRLHPNLQIAGYCACVSPSGCVSTLETLAAIIDTCAHQQVPLHIQANELIGQEITTLESMIRAYHTAIRNESIGEEAILEILGGERNQTVETEDMNNASPTLLSFSMPASTLDTLAQ